MSQGIPFCKRGFDFLTAINAARSRATTAIIPVGALNSGTPLGDVVVVSVVEVVLVVVIVVVLVVVVVVVVDVDELIVTVVGMLITCAAQVTQSSVPVTVAVSEVAPNVTGTLYVLVSHRFP